MKPISFSCHATVALAPDDIARQILDVTKWLDFKGYGPIPVMISRLRSSRSARPKSSALESESPTRTARSTSSRSPSTSPVTGSACS